ncbi:hypothetical protein E4O97_22920 [Pseudomonas sp. W15Feb34]|uniref:Uncharacterized protein n=1 Tax=Pseudomonas synxantha TaxID=47883 RepID=A0A5D3GFF0_9PSED|nr:hypothetical protein [Pseudomonas sp. W15Feb34]MCK3854413.1 hypothetical protein [Pseudomonas sp. W2Jun17]MCK3861616.1 hypothetical protein [Pseudomonas sp. B329]TYK59156.1 hypothetical protein FXO26_05900 [Pseudomonas synxantha]
MRIRGKLQNFAKAAILAIAQKNCSIPCALFCSRLVATALNSVRLYHRYMTVQRHAQTVSEKLRYLSFGVTAAN